MKRQLQPKISLLVTGYWLLVTGLVGCGYTTRSYVSDLYKTIYIKPFENRIDITDETAEYRRFRITRPLLEKEITTAVIDRFILDGNLRVRREEEANVILSGKVTELRKDALRYTDDEDVKEYRISLVSDLSLYDKKNGKMLWDERIIGDTTYFTQGAQAKSEDSAIEDAITDFARRVVERTIEEW